MNELKYTEKGLERRLKQHISAVPHELFAVVQPGFEGVAHGELASLGVTDFANEAVEGGVAFSGKIDLLQHLHLFSRTVTRFLMRVQRLRAERFDILHKKLAAINWELYLNRDDEIAFSVTSSQSMLYHEKRIEETAAAAIRESLDRYFEPASPAPHSRSRQTVYIRIENNRVQVSIDASGDSLYKRGYKLNITGAPLRETLAASILQAAHHEKYDIILDPMCGSGTFSLEAGCAAHGIIPGGSRDFAFTGWPSHRDAAYLHMKKKALEGHLDEPGHVFPVIVARDSDGAVVKAANENLSSAGLSPWITAEERNFFTDIFEVPADKKSLIVLNPPYGERLSSFNTGALYRKIGDTLRTHYPRSGYAIIVPGLENEKVLSLPYDKKILFMNGGIRVAVLIRNGF